MSKSKHSMKELSSNNKKIFVYYNTEQNNNISLSTAESNNF